MLWMTVRWNRGIVFAENIYHSGDGCTENFVKVIQFTNKYFYLYFWEEIRENNML